MNVRHVYPALVKRWEFIAWLEESNRLTSDWNIVLFPCPCQVLESKNQIYIQCIIITFRASLISLGTNSPNRNRVLQMGSMADSNPQNLGFSASHPNLILVSPARAEVVGRRHIGTDWRNRRRVDRSRTSRRTQRLFFSSKLVRASLKQTQSVILFIWIFSIKKCWCFFFKRMLKLLTLKNSTVIKSHVALNAQGSQIVLSHWRWSNR